MSSSTASRLFDDLRTRLDTPLFARDPGMTPSTGVPRLKELTWEHVVNTGAGQSDEDGEASEESAAEEAAPDASVVEESSSEEQDEAPVEETPVEEAAVEQAPVNDALVEEPVDGRVGEVVTADFAPEVEPAAPEVEERPATPSEPSLFARIMAGDADRAPRSGEHAVVPHELDQEEPVLRIAEPAPAPRPSDPVVDGLAELIARATPETPPAPAPSVAAAATVEPVVPEHTVQAEIDRLAFVPDSAIDDGPVEVPAILVSGVVPAITPPSTPAVAAIAAAAAPVAAPAPAAAPSAPLSLAQGEVFTAKSSAAPASTRQVFMPFAPEALPTRKKKKRHGFRRFVTMLVLLGMVGGGLFAVKKYVIDARWDAEVKAYADEVAVARGLEWKQPVGLEELPADEYATKLAVRALGDDQNVAEEWRA
ncbi:MAG TPA: hypothetical protein VL916_03800, partial [Ilumatobacteraceae bacterium]|nr:hypothetical protein [Ilumatobacteraceae bacterium]